MTKRQDVQLFEEKKMIRRIFFMLFVILVNKKMDN